MPFSINQQANPALFPSSGWVIVPIPSDRWMIILSGIVEVNFAGNPLEWDWRSDTLELLLDLRGPIVATGVPNPPPGQEFTFEAEQWSPLATLNSFVHGPSEDSGPGIAVQAARYTFSGSDFTIMEVDLSVAQSNATLLKIGYHLTLLGHLRTRTVDHL